MIRSMGKISHDVPKQERERYAYFTVECRLDDLVDSANNYGKDENKAPGPERTMGALAFLCMEVDSLDPPQHADICLSWCLKARECAGEVRRVLDGVA